MFLKISPNIVGKLSPNIVKYPHLLPSGNGTSAERYLTIFDNIWQGKYSHLKLEIVAQKYC